MKLGFLLFFLCIGNKILIAQIVLRPAPGAYHIDQKEKDTFNGNRDVIWMEDFSNGINSGWQNTEQGSVASWEFRGPLTNPNVEVGTRGSCLPEGVLGDPIASSSWQNGFVIFDSNWWDNPDNPCTPDNFGIGPAPGPHLATLTSPSIDLANFTAVALTFNQYLKIYNGETRVEISINGGPWSVVFVNPSIPNPTLTDDQQYIQISSLAAGQSDVKFRFVFDGLYYFWMLDDIAIVETFSNDLAIRNSTYGDYDLFDLSHPTGYEFLEYSKYPDEMAPQLKFSTQADNLGSFDQTNCRLNVEIIDVSDNVVYSGQSTEGFTIGSGSSMELRSGNYQMPTDLGSYRVAFDTSQDSVEEFEFNNRDTMAFNINDVQYARDHYFTSAVYLGSPEYASTQYEVGNVFLVTADNLSCHSISVGVGIGSTTPASIYGALYSFDWSATPPATLIATTQSVELTPEMINSFGDQIMTNLTFATPVPVSAGTVYFVAAGCQEGPDYFVCAMSGDAEEFTAVTRFFPQDWYYLDRIPMVRMNFGFYNEIAEVKSPRLDLSVYPVPAGSSINVSSSEWMNQDCEILILDHTGRTVLQRCIKNNQQSIIMLDLNHLAGGMYELMLRSENKIAHAKFIRE